MKKAKPATDERDDGVLGPALRRLTAKQQKFVIVYATHPGITIAQAAEAAGYGNPASGLSPRNRKNVLANSGYRILQDQRVIDAIKEVAGKKIVSEAIEAARFLSDTFRNPNAPLALRIRSAESLLNRGGLVGEQNIKVEHLHRDETGEAMAERIRTLAVRLGMDPGKLLGGNTTGNGTDPPKQLLDLSPVDFKSLAR